MIRSYRVLKGEDYFPNPASIVIVRAEEYFDFPYHSHDFIEFAFVAEGHGYHHIEQEITSVSAGQLLIIPVGTSHVLRPSTPNQVRDRLVVYNCMFSPAVLQSLTGLMVESELVRFVERIREDNAKAFTVLDANGSIAGLIAAMYNEFSFAENRSYTYLNSLLLQLIVSIYRLKDVGSSSAVKPTQSVGFSYALEFLEHKYAEQITLAQLADKMQWSERQLQRLFRKHTRQSFRSFLQELRIRKSCELLRDGAQKINVIAGSVGYKDMQSFTSVFKRVMGKTPGAYRAGSPIAGGDGGA